jgi:hypothetical protein
MLKIAVNGTVYVNLEDFPDVNRKLSVPVSFDCGIPILQIRRLWLDLLAQLAQRPIVDRFVLWCTDTTDSNYVRMLRCQDPILALFFNKRGKKHTTACLRWWSPSAHGSGIGGSPLYSGHSGQIFTYLNIPHPNIQPVQQKVYFLSRPKKV